MRFIVAVGSVVPKQVGQSELCGTDERIVGGVVIKDLNGEGGGRVDEEAIGERNLEDVIPDGICAASARNSGGVLGEGVDKGDGKGIHLASKEANVLETFGGHDRELDSWLSHEE